MLEVEGGDRDVVGYARDGEDACVVVLRIRGVLAKYLVETPIAADQAVAAIDSEWTRVQATVQDTIQLRSMRPVIPS